MLKFQNLFRKIFPRPATIEADKLQSLGSASPEQLEMLKRIGTTLTPSEIIFESTQMNFERERIYQELDKSQLHWLMGAALELFTDVAVTHSSVHNSTVWITSKNRTYERELNDLLNTIGTEEKISDWGSSVALYGDLFIKVQGAPGVGITSVCDDDHPIHISRIDDQGILIGFYETPYGAPSGGGGTSLELLPPWSFVHFRLLGARKRRAQYGDPQFSEYNTISILSPDKRRVSTRYGTSVLMNALPAYKRLRLAEDSLLLARLTRGLLKYIYKLRVDGCLRFNTRIKLLDGTTPTIGEMAENEKEYVGKYVLTVNEETLELEPNKIKAAKKTRRQAEMVRVHLDNGEFVDCTPDHLCMLRSGKYVEAQELTPGDSLMPFYTKISEKQLEGYELTYDPGKETYRYNHRIVEGFAGKGYAIHHCDFDKLNNDPSNLKRMCQSDHMKLHHACSKKYGFSKSLPGSKQSPEHIQKRIDSRRKNGWISEEGRKNQSIAAKKCYENGKVPSMKGKHHSEETLRKLSNTLREGFKKGRKPNRGGGGVKKVKTFRSKLCECGCKEYFKLKPSYPQQRYIPGHNSRGQNNNNSRTSKEKRERQYLNHKVVRVERLTEREDVYDLQIENTPNFPLACGIFVHNSNTEAIAAMIDEYVTSLKRARAVDTALALFKEVTYSSIIAAIASVLLL